jgi:hypothetical protein
MTVKFLPEIRISYQNASEILSEYANINKLGFLPIKLAKKLLSYYCLVLRDENTLVTKEEYC